ncbi:virulence protein [Modestobacter caceresii]|uniref:Virulence protein n=1 Tax=Modestobacter caceresii TaxID=1522368 RepID=A0A098Y631_9ACTN|nr:VOC family protein [Modestobacter caceresii]KGH45959.1 virulence protein [Modestobacter caceresii]
MRIDRIDHLVLTVADLDRTLDFYTQVLGMTAETFGEGRTALRFGRQKINLHVRGAEFEPRAAHAGTGAADFCLVTEDPLDQVRDELAAHGVPIEVGPVTKQGALGEMRSVYVRDPDANLVEISAY